MPRAGKVGTCPTAELAAGAQHGAMNGEKRDTPRPGPAPSVGDLTIPPVYGRAGRGAASILPHLTRWTQERVVEADGFDQPPPADPRWSVLGGLGE